MPTQTPITAYSITYSANTFARRIALKNKTKFIGECYFYNHSTNPLPDDAEVLVNGKPYYTLSYYIEDFANIIAILNNTKKKFLFFNGSGGLNENGISME
jgi:hypothetical protein